MHKLFSILLMTIFFFSIHVTTCSAVYDDPYLVNITINNTENVTLANHNNSPLEGNWIYLSGGTPVKMPTLNFIYNSINATSYTTSNGPVNITSSVENYPDYKIEYPYSVHPMYTNVSGKKEVNMSFNGSSFFANKSIDVYLISTTPTELRDAFNDITNGNTTRFRDLLNKSVTKYYNSSLDAAGDNTSINFGAVDAGDYVIFVLLNSSYLDSTRDLTILSATAIEVLEYESVVSAPVQASTNTIINITITLDNASQGNYTYGLALVHSDAYQADIRLEFNGTRASTNLTADGAYLVEGYKIAGIGLSNVNKTTVQDIIDTIIGDNNGLVLIPDSENTTSKSILVNTNGLREGNYILLVGVYKSGERLVAFNQSEITITPIAAPPTTPGGGGGGLGGGPSGEAYTNIVCTETDRQYVNKDTITSFKFRSECNIVKYINFTGLTSSGRIAAKIEMLDHTSTLVDRDPPEIVYKNFNVWVGNLGWFSENNVADPEITFIVEKSWVENNNIMLNTISLYRFNKDTWNKIPAQKIGEDSTRYYFKAYLPVGPLGPMAVSGQPAMVFPTPTPEITPVTTPTPEISPTAPPITWTELWKKNIPGFQILPALIMIIILYIIGRKRD